MAKKSVNNIKIASIDDLFSNEEVRSEERLEKIQEIPLDSIVPFKNHPFKVKLDDKMIDLIESIQEHDVLVPALLRPNHDGGYEMVSGHRRLFASKQAKKETIPAIVRELTDDEATIIMVDSNIQREEILPSEKAFAYKMKLEAMARQGKRLDLTSDPLGRKLSGKETAEIVAEQVGESKSQVRRYIRLTNLIESLLDLVDNGRIAFRPAVELSYLKKDEQERLFAIIELNEATPSLSQAISLKKLSQENNLDENAMDSLMSVEKPNQQPKVVLKQESLNKYFPKDYTNLEIEKIIYKLLDKWSKDKKRDLERER